VRVQVSVPNSERHGGGIAAGANVWLSCPTDAIVVLAD